MTPPRIDVKEAKQRNESSDAMIVCAYDSEDKFHANHLQGAIALDDLKAREASLSKDRELIFYCA